MHSHNRGGSWIYTPLNGLDQFRRNRNFEKCWGCAGHHDSSHHFDIEGIHTKKISSSIVGLNSGNSFGDELRFRIHDV
jgi:hypothetical protein